MTGNERATYSDAHCRALLLRLVNDEPGCTLREARTKTGLHHRCLLRYLEAMVGQGAVLAVEDRGRVHLLPAGYEACWRQAVAMRNPALAKLYGLLQQHGQMVQVRVIATASQLFGWPRTATRKRLTALQEAGLATRIKLSQDARAVWHKPLALHPKVRPAVGVVAAVSIHHERNVAEFSMQAGRGETAAEPIGPLVSQ